jgi:hypothetical protein
LSLATGSVERAKFVFLLELSQEQIQALECDDMFALDRILAAKRTLIESLNDARGVLAADPTLAAVVTRIQDADKMAQRLLYRKVGRIMREMNELSQQKKARGAYQPTSGREAAKPIGFLPDTPSYLDVKS